MSTKTKTPAPVVVPAADVLELLPPKLRTNLETAGTRLSFTSPQYAKARTAGEFADAMRKTSNALGKAAAWDNTSTRGTWWGQAFTQEIPAEAMTVPYSSFDGRALRAKFPAGFEAGVTFRYQGIVCQVWALGRGSWIWAVDTNGKAVSIDTKHATVEHLGGADADVLF